MRRIILRAMGTAALCLLGGRLATAQQEKPLTADKFFKNVKVLTGMPLNEFMTTMGFFSASLGYSFENCHGEDSGLENYAAEDREKKQTARRMIGMVANLNKAYFGGRQVVTCYSCHRGGNQPKITPNLAALYSPPTEEANDVIPQAPKAPPVDQIFDKYLQAIGGTQRLASLTSFVAKGASVGYGIDADKHPLEIFAKAPAQRSVVVHTPKGDNVTTYDGRVGWMAGPQIAGPDIAVPPL